MSKVSLTADTISHKDIDELCKWLQTYPKLTKGELTLELEDKFAQRLKNNYSVFVNSGSSANLLMLSTLKAEGKLKIGDRVGVPALCWSTDLAPVIQLGLEPVLLDCNGYNLGIETKNLESLINEFDIRCIILVSVLGIPGNLDTLVRICNNYNVVLLEDNCESLGSRFLDIELGNFGYLSSWSTYFSHHISTIEGGFVTCRDIQTKELMDSIRSHGWHRDSKKQDTGFYAPYLFHELGYNIRNTEIGAFLGLRQLNILDDIIKVRNDNFLYFCERMSKWLYTGAYNQFTWYQLRNDKDRFVSSFGLPVLHPFRDKCVAKLKAQNIECRPLIAGDIGQHPVAAKYKVLNAKNNFNAKIIHEYGFYLPNHAELTTSHIDTMVDVLEGTK